MTNLYEITQCSKCKKDIERIDAFPRQQCIECYAKDNTDERGDYDTITQAFSGAIIN